MSYDSWKTQSPDDDHEQPGDEPSELDLVYADLHRITAERDALRKALEGLLGTTGALDGCTCSSCQPVHNARAALATVSVPDAEHGGPG